MAFLTSYFWILIVVIFFLISAVKILAEYERGVIFRLGRALDHAKGPGMIILIPIVDRMVKVNLQLVTYDVPSQDIITRDNVTMKVNAVVYFRVIDPRQGHHRGAGLLCRHPAAGPNHAAQCLRPGGNGRFAFRTGESECPVG